MALSTDQKLQQLLAVGYNGPSDAGSVEAAFARTATASDAAANPPNLPGIANTDALNQTPAPATTTSDAGAIAQANAQMQAAQLADQQAQRALAASTAANAQTFAEQVRQFNATHDLALQQFGVSVGQLTGQYNGQPTLAAQGQQFNQAIAQGNLLGYYTPPGGAAGAGGTAGGGAPTQAQYVAARTQQLQGTGMSAVQAQQTATAEWTQGFAQSGNVAGGLPPGISFSGAGATSGGPTQAQYIAARAQQLQGTGMPALQAAQTATAEWTQGFAQSGKVAGGLPQGISFGAPATGGTTANGIPAGAQQTLAGQLQQAQLSGQYNGQPTEAARQFNAAQAEQQRQFNINTQADLTKTAAGLSGPANYFKYLNAINGGQNVLGSLYKGGGGSVGAPVGATQPQTIQNILGQLGVGGQTGGASWQTGGYAGNSNNTNSGTGIMLPYGMGQLPYMNQIQPTAWNNMGQGGQDFLKGAYAAAGLDPNDLTRAVGQGTAAVGTAPSSGTTTYANPGSQSLFG